MVQTRRVAAHAVDVLCRVVGRQFVVRVARFTLNRARLDVPNIPTSNGEYALQRWLLGTVPAGRPATVLDVGASVGNWSSALLAQARRTGRADQLRLHAFEPDAQAHQQLVERLPNTVRINHCAVSDRVGEATLHQARPGADTNSLYPVPVGDVATEQVRTTTLDTYLRDSGIEQVDLLKIDTEGHDVAVMTGAVDAFRRQAIALVQFEYNIRWLPPRYFLKDAFDLLMPLGYRLGKLTPRGVEFYPRWEPELETFLEGNYVAATAGMADRLPAVIWWNVRLSPAPAAR